MKARLRQTRWIAMMAAASVLGGGAFAPLQAQQRGVPTPTTPRLVVVNFRSADKVAGVAAADAVRDRLQRDISARNLWVITKRDIEANLEQSGYPVDEALSTNDARALAALLRADEFVDGSVTRTDNGYRVDARIVLSRNPELVQPLPSITVSRPQDAGGQLARPIQDALRQMEAERQCYNLARQQQYDQAAEQARRAIAAYERSTVGRACLLEVRAQQEAPPQELLSLANEILEIDPRSRPALRRAYLAYQQLDQEDQALATLTRLMAADPGNIEIRTTVTNELARTGRFEDASRVISEALQENPHDPQLMQTAFLVYLGAQEWRQAIQVGEELARVDTAAADTTYFVRLAAAYQGDNQPQRAAEAIARGTTKFPNNTGLLVSAAQMYRQAGQLPQAVEALQRALRANPRTPRANLTLAQIYVDMNQSEQAIAALQAAVAAGDSTDLVAQYSLGLGQTAMRAGQQSQNMDDFRRAAQFAEFSDRTQASDNAKFIHGVSSYYLGQLSASRAQETRDCSMWRQAAAAWESAQRSIVGGGGRVNAEAAGQIMGQIQQYLPAIQQQASRCR